ncbi:hypothetical protein FQR65_LT20269 [Abscondita terminalis]|nr:hypothetical protein FQR65_LT20269 [Abscondita terminalis]
MNGGPVSKCAFCLPELKTTRGLMVEQARTTMIRLSLGGCIDTSGQCEGYGARFLRGVGAGCRIWSTPSPTKFDDKASYLRQKATGIKVKNIKAVGHQLRFDDSTGQISAQLQSSHGASQLNLGKLSHPKHQAESDDRGEGFELRTDEWGAIRAAKGLFVGTDAQLNADDQQLDIRAANFNGLNKLWNKSKCYKKVLHKPKLHPKEGYTRIPSLQQQLDDQLKTMAKPKF